MTTLTSCWSWTHIFRECLRKNKIDCSYGAQVKFFFYQKKCRQSRDTVPLRTTPSFCQALFTFVVKFPWIFPSILCCCCCCLLIICCWQSFLPIGFLSSCRHSSFVCIPRLIANFSGRKCIGFCTENQFLIMYIHLAPEPLGFTSF